MKKLIILPHQDDELFCYSQLGEKSDLIIVFRGGGEPKGYKLSEEELFIRRCDETIKTCKDLNVSNISFLEVKRPYTSKELDAAIKNVLQKVDFDIIITTMIEDKHEDHVNLSKSVLKNTKKPVYGFIVQTDAILKYKTNTDYIEIKLTDDDYKHKLNLVKNYITQKHFLPNVLKRSIYKTELFWRLN